MLTANAPDVVAWPGRSGAGLNGSSLQVSLDSLVSDVRALNKLKVSKSCSRGRVLFSEGQEPRAIYFLAEGRAKISIGSAEGRTLVLRIAQPGDLLGVNAALTDEPYNVTAETIERSRIEVISRQDLLKLLERDKTACFNMARALGQTLNRTVEHSRLLLLSQSAAEKLAQLLIQWYDELGYRTPEGVQINSGLTHEQMAQMICASRETVTRLLNQFKRRQILSLFNGTILIKDRKSLEAVTRSGAG
jgi:CRP/FNR family transcriptional regulator